MSEREIPPSKEETERGEGTITRMVTAERTDSPAWTRSGRAKDAPAVPNRWEIADGGWIFHGDERTPLFPDDRAALVVGREYLSVETYTTCLSDHGEWVSMMMLPLQDGVVNWPDDSSRKTSRGAAQMEGKSAAEIASTLRSTQADPRAAKYMSLERCDRWQHVATGSHGTSTPELGPGEKHD